MAEGMFVSTVAIILVHAHVSESYFIGRAIKCLVL